MERREFLKKSMAAGITLGSTLATGSYEKLFAESHTPYDLVAIKGGTPDTMFDRGIKSLGGMEKFIKKGNTVVVKPNIGWAATPERAANTNPKLVKRIIEHCYKAGAKQVYVLDNTCNNWTECYEKSGIKQATIDAKGKIVPGNREKYYHEVKIRKGKSLKSAKVHELILESDVFINVPILKNHGSTKLTIAMKNLMGIVWDTDRRFWHSNNLHQCIADFPTFRKPDLNIVDAYNIMKRNGPRGVSVDDVIKAGSQIISTDIVAADAAAAKIFGILPADIPHIRYAHEMGTGNMNLEKLNINKIRIS